MENIVSIINEITTNNQKIASLLKKNEELSSCLMKAPLSDWDWVTVRTASEVTGLCPATIYAKVNSGELNTKHIASKVLISATDLCKLNDRRA